MIGEVQARLDRAREVALAPSRLRTAVQQVARQGELAARSLDDVLSMVTEEWEKRNG